MRIGIIGTGNMGRAIGLTLAETGCSVFFGSRTVKKAEETAALSSGEVFFGSNQDAAEFGDVVYYNPRDVNPVDVLDDIAALNNKIVISSHNGAVPSDFSFQPITDSRAEILQRQIPNANVVTAFNTITQEIFELANRQLSNFNIACFIASDHEMSKNTVAKLIARLGFDPVDCGKLQQSRLIESAADLVRMLLYRKNTPWISFSLTSVSEVENSRLGGRQVSRLHNKLTIESE